MKFLASKLSSRYYLLLTNVFGIIFDYDNEEGVECFTDLKDYGNDVEITKEEFIEANRDLLEKTGLINLFEEPLKWKESYHQREQIKTLEKELDKANQETARFNSEILKGNIKSLEAVIEKQQEKIEDLYRTQNTLSNLVDHERQWKDRLDRKIEILEKLLKSYL